ncbi:MAG: YdcF family protein [Clostridia bacterium]|nr:YdcF family protein [Clostridia bacterium]
MSKKTYGIISVLLFIMSIVILAVIDKTSNIKLSLAIQIILVVYLIKITYGCLLYIKEQYKKQKYSYSIIMNLGLVLFLIINILRQINLLIVDWNEISIEAIYKNTLESFSYFAYFILPFIIILAVYSVITNIFLIKKEKLRAQNLLGILFGIGILIGIFASQVLYEGVKNSNFIDSQLILKKFIDIGINSILCYFYCLTLATLYCNIMAAKHKPYYDKDFIIILGTRMKDDGSLTPILKARVDKAIEFAKEQKEQSGKDIIFIPSGGQGKDEIMSEAEAMKTYLLKNGIKEENIIIENQSKNTLQNMKFSKNIINEINENGKIAFATTNYHVFRSGVIANNQGIDCEGMGSNTKWYFYTNALIREFIANIVSQRKKHFVIITSINIVLFILVLIGYNFNLL